ncbi:MAG TPA: NAD-dependent epimerase/dehydratase family protein [Caulobacteraceae bacterium]
MGAFVSGGAGFIGANLVARLIAEGGCVVAADNFVRGSRRHLAGFDGHPRFCLVEADLATSKGCAAAFEAADRFGPIETVWHLAANSDIAAGLADPRIDLRDTFMTTFEILGQMRRIGARRLIFASSSAVYGDFGEVELHEDIGPLTPISNYGAMKLASEAQACAAVEDFLEQALLLRFPNVIGSPSTHGVIFDFVRRLRDEPAVLRVMGDGTQRKPYLHVSELIEAMVLARDKAPGGVHAYNIGPSDIGVTVALIAQCVADRVSPTARLEFGDGPRGWVGDVPRFRYSIERIARLGWAPRLSSRQAVSRAIDEIIRQDGA